MAFDVQEQVGTDTAIGTAETVLATLTTSLPSGAVVLVIAEIDFDNLANTTTRSILAGNLKLEKSSPTPVVILDDNNAKIPVSITSRPDETVHKVLIASRTLAAANEAFRVVATADGVDINGQAHIIAVRVDAVDSVDAAAVILSDVEQTIASLTSTVPTSTDCWVVARCELYNGTADPDDIAAGNLKLVRANAGDVLLDDNHSIINLAVADDPTLTYQHRTIVLFAKRTTAAANEIFAVKATATQPDSTMQVHMAVIRAADLVIEEDDAAQVAVDTTETVLATVASTVPNGNTAFAMARSQFFNTNTAAARRLDAGNSKLKAAGVVLADNADEMRLSRTGVGNLLNRRQQWGYEIGRRVAAAANETYEKTGQANLNLSSINAQSRLVVIHEAAVGPLGNSEIMAAVGELARSGGMVGRVYR